jgi:hypothetical protein
MALAAAMDSATMVSRRSDRLPLEVTGFRLPNSCCIPGRCGFAASRYIVGTARRAAIIAPDLSL